MTAARWPMPISREVRDGIGKARLYFRRRFLGSSGDITIAVMVNDRSLE